MTKWSLNTKIYSVMGLLILAAILISYMGLTKMHEIKTSLNSIVHGAATRVGNAHEIKELFFIQIINEKNLILESDPERAAVQLKRLHDRDVQVKAAVDNAESISTEVGKKDLARFSELYKEWWAMNDVIKGLVREGKNTEAFQISGGKGREMRLKTEELIDGIVKRNEGFMLSSTKEAEADYEIARNLVLMISIGSIVGGLVLGSFILKQVGSAIGEVVQSLNDGSTQVTEAAQLIASSSEELSQAATEQAASIEQTASAIEEMNSMVQKNAESARRTSELALSSNRSADKGKSVVRNMIQAIDDISDSNNNIKNQIDESNQKISEIVKVISEIGNKTKVINDIVFQTKLLSFNASVEAARAGEHGKGFAVVAEEVGNLAQMSGNAAKEISDMLEGSIQKVENIVNETKTKVTTLIIDGKSRVEVGTKIAHECGSVLNEIVDNISGVNQMASEISTACQEQAVGVHEITKAMSQLDQVTQINATASEQVAASAEELSGQSESLHSAIGILISIIKGSDHSTNHLVEIPVVRKAQVHHVPSRKSNVIPLKSRSKMTKKLGKKQSLGADLKSIPSENDPRFEEV
jgi:methyl-accepting chemotaxis protein